jgi:acetoin utilization deacetylase AcuC-like enzyme
VKTAEPGRSWLDHRDNSLSYDTYDAALTAAAAGPAAVDVIERGDGGDLPFCLVRPPGHHAEKARAMGFCFLNNVVIAARYWQKTHGRKRIAVVDWDAHHGNGIQHAFEGEGDVLYISIHEHPTFSFPGTGYAEERGTGEGAGATLNIPLRPGDGDDAVQRAIGESVESALENFAPEALIIAAGFDGHSQDDMSGLTFSTGLYGELGAAARRWAGKLCGGRLVSILEGGYHLPVLGESVGSYLAALAGG